MPVEYSGPVIIHDAFDHGVVFFYKQDLWNRVEAMDLEQRAAFNEQLQHEEGLAMGIDGKVYTMTPDEFYAGINQALKDADAAPYPSSSFYLEKGRPFSSLEEAVRYATVINGFERYADIKQAYLFATTGRERQETLKKELEALRQELLPARALLESNETLRRIVSERPGSVLEAAYRDIVPE